MMTTWIEDAKGRDLRIHHRRDHRLEIWVPLGAAGRNFELGYDEVTMLIDLLTRARERGVAE